MVGLVWVGLTLTGCGDCWLCNKDKPYQPRTTTGGSASSGLITGGTGGSGGTGAATAPGSPMAWQQQPQNTAGLNPGGNLPTGGGTPTSLNDTTNQNRMPATGAVQQTGGVMEQNVRPSDPATIRTNYPMGGQQPMGVIPNNQTSMGGAASQNMVPDRTPSPTDVPASGSHNSGFQNGSVGMTDEGHGAAIGGAPQPPPPPAMASGHSAGVTGELPPIPSETPASVPTGGMVKPIPPLPGSGQASGTN
jgi:hypothetical protein